MSDINFNWANYPYVARYLESRSGLVSYSDIIKSTAKPAEQPPAAGPQSRPPLPAVQPRPGVPTGSVIPPWPVVAEVEAVVDDQFETLVQFVDGLFEPYRLALAPLLWPLFVFQCHAMVASSSVASTAQPRAAGSAGAADLPSKVVQLDANDAGRLAAMRFFGRFSGLFAAAFPTQSAQLRDFLSESPPLAVSQNPVPDAAHPPQQSQHSTDTDMKHQGKNGTDRKDVTDAKGSKSLRGAPITSLEALLSVTPTPVTITVPGVVLKLLTNCIATKGLASLAALLGPHAVHVRAGSSDKPIDVVADYPIGCKPLYTASGSAQFGRSSQTGADTFDLGAAAASQALDHEGSELAAHRLSVVLYTTFMQSAADVTDMCFDLPPDGNPGVLVASSDAVVRRFDATSKGSLSYSGVIARHSGPVFSIDVLAGSNRLGVSGGVDGVLRAFDVVSGAVVCHTPVSQLPLWRVAASPFSSSWVVTASADRTARLYDIHRPSPLRLMAGHLTDVTSVAWHPSLPIVATGCGDRTIRIFDLASGNCVRLYDYMRCGVAALAWSPCGLMMAAGSDDGSVAIADLRAGRLLAGGRPPALGAEQEAPAWSLSWLARRGSSVVISGSAAPHVGVSAWRSDSASDGPHIVSYATADTPVLRVKCLPNGTVLAAGAYAVSNVATARTAVASQPEPSA